MTDQETKIKELTQSLIEHIWEQELSDFNEYCEMESISDADRDDVPHVFNTIKELSELISK